MINTLFFIILFGLILLLCGIFTGKKTLKTEMFSIDHTDIAKGIACIMVVLHHIAGKEGTVLFSPFGGIGICIFLICSGYGLSASYKKHGLKNFIVKRFFRIIIPCLAVSIITFTYLRFTGGNYSVITKSYTFWYTNYIGVIYIIFYIIYKFFYKYRIPLIIITIAFYSMLKGYPVTIQQLFSFSAGVLIFEYSNKLIFIDNYKCKIFIGSSFVILSALFLLIKNIFEINYVIAVSNCLMIMFGALGIMLLSSFLLKVKCISKALKYIGKLSYEVYLVHVIILKLFAEIKFTPFVSLCYIVAFIIISKLIFEFSNYATKVTLKFCNKKEISND